MNINQDILDIIAAKLNGEKIADNEQETLDNWLDDCTENKKIFQEYKDIYQNKEDIAFFEGIDANNAWKNHLNRVNSSKGLNLRPFLKYAAIILPIIIASSILLNWVKWDILSSGDYCNIVVSRGQMQEIVLADGTRVWINSDSEFKYPKEFKGNTREVYLKGEGYFSVTKNREKPFVVNSDLMNIKVLGTEFNLSCYENSENVEATLFEGKISYSTKDKEGILEPGFQAVFNKGSKKVVIRKVDVSEFSSWKDGIYLFDGIKIEDLVVKISRWYNIEVVFKSESVKTMEFTGAMERDKPVDFIIELLEETNSVKCDFKEGVLYIDIIP